MEDRTTSAWVVTRTFVLALYTKFHPSGCLTFVGREGRWRGLIIEERKETVLRAAAVLPPGFRKADVMRRSQFAINLSRALTVLVGEGKLRREGDRNQARYWLGGPPAFRFPAL
jgi:hypothetical protein